MSPPPARRAMVLTISDRASAGSYLDRSGPLLVAGLTELGFQVGASTVVPDGAPVGEALRAAIAQRFPLIVTTGGTGVTPRDQTPEQTRPVLERELPGIAEAIRAKGISNQVPTAMLSRGVAGIAGDSVVINLPGSTGACRDGLAVLAPVLHHLLDQLGGEGHP